MRTSGQFLAVFLLGFATFGFGQAAPSKNSATGSNAPTAGSTPARSGASDVAQDDADDDDPDVPAFSHISHEEYLRLRSEHVAVRRGMSDLAINPQARSQAIRRMETQEQTLHTKNKALASTSGQAVTNVLGGTWISLGPEPIPNGQTFVSSVPVSGRVTVIAIDPADSSGNTVYVGAAQGGVYRTLDGGATWTALLDSAQSLAIGSITIDPTDHNTVLVGTGEGNLALDSFFGVGIYVIQNATSVTPTISGPFHTEAGTGNDIFTGRSVTKIIVNPSDHNLVLAATSSGVSGASGDTFSSLPTRGVYLSTNFLSGSPTFTKLVVQSVLFPGTENRPVTDMAMDPGNPNLILVNVLGQTTTEGGVWVSPSTVWSGTGAWTQGLQIATGANGKLAVNRSGSTPATTFYAAEGESIGCNTSTVSGTLRTSVNGGTTWTELPKARGFCGGQCFYDMPVAVDPNNANNIFIGGQSGSTVGACGSSSFGRSIDGGATFSASQASLHADSHAIAIFSGDPTIMYEGNDGGIFRSSDAGASWTSRNTAGFNATQFESLAIHPTDPTFTIGGTQDNGTEFLQPGGAWTRADGGDGGFSAIDQTAADTTNVTMYHTYFNSSGSQIGFARVMTVGSVWNFFGCGGASNGITCSDSVLFYAPLALGPGTPNTVYFGSDRLYRSTNQGTNMTVVSQAPIVTAGSGGVPVSAIGISPQDDNVRIVGLRDGSVWATTTGSATLTNITGGWAAKYIARTVIDPNNKFTAYVTLDGYGTANHVWKTINLNAATPTWTPTSTNLPDVPVNAFAVDPASSSNIYAGTDIGVFCSTDGGLTWNPLGSGLPRVAVFDLKVTSLAAGHKVRIATHGRGMWQIAALGGAGTTTSLSSNLSNPVFGTQVSLTAAVNIGGGVTPATGSVAFIENSNTLGTVTVASGSAGLQISTLSVGSHSITAQYSGDANYAGSASSPVAVNVANAPNADYAINFPTNSSIVKAGSSASYTVNITTTNGFGGTVNFACPSGLPSLTTCSFTPSSVTVSGNSGSSALSISTTAPTAATPAPGLSSRLTGAGLFALGMVLAGLAGRKRRLLQSALMLVVVLGLLVGLSSCGGGGSNVQHNPGTPAGTYTVTVSATSGTTTHQTTITLVVQ
jgi:hypothetical protein